MNLMPESTASARPAHRVHIGGWVRQPRWNCTGFGDPAWRHTAGPCDRYRPDQHAARVKGGDRASSQAHLEELRLAAPVYPQPQQRGRHQ